MRSTADTRLTRPARAARSASNGFTLVELMLVIVILSVLAGAVVTNMRAGYLMVALESDAEALAELIDSGQQYARSRHCVVRLTIDRDLNEYYLRAAPMVGSPYEPLTGELAPTIGLSDGVSFAMVDRIASADAGSGDSEDEDGIRFHPDGRSDSALIVLEAGRREESTVLIGSLFGRPRIERP